MVPSGIVTSGLSALDQVLQGLRLGDNVVWHVNSVEDYQAFVEPYCAKAVAAGGRVVRADKRGFDHFG